MNKTIALISGANQGIGLATARQLARDHDFHVLMGSRNAANGTKAAQQLQAEGLSVESVQLDLASDDSITGVADYIAQKYGRLDVLINNAGILIDGELGHKVNPNITTRQLFDLTLSTNVTGPACLTEAVTPLLRKAKQRPSVVFVSSRMGSLAESVNPDTPFYKADYKSYDASKAAVNILVTNYARILGEDMRARVNSVCPGLIKTNLTGYMEGGGTTDDGAQRIVEMVTLAEDDETTATFSDRWGKIDW
jgi:NAD(P)-dependent dehydrogenase (short-subunit alcohol dehydrogenase family)